MADLSQLKESMTKVKECSDIVESFIDGSKEIIDSLINSTKVIADFSKHARTSNSSLARPSSSHVGDISHLLGTREKDICGLHVNGFDSEQIWQEIEISNDPLLNILSSKIRQFCNNENGLSLFAHRGKSKDKSAMSNKKHHADQQKTRLKSIQEKAVTSSNALLVSNSDNIDDDFCDAEHRDTTLDKRLDAQSEAGTKAPIKKSVVDDGFFVLEDMNRFLDYEDKREMRKNDGEVDNDIEDIDYFGEDFESVDDSSDDGVLQALESDTMPVGRSSKFKRKMVDAKAVMYADFFDDPILQKNKTPKKSLSRKENRSKLEHALVAENFGDREDEIENEENITKAGHGVMDYDNDGDDEDNDSASNGVVDDDDDDDDDDGDDDDDDGDDDDDDGGDGGDDDGDDGDDDDDGGDDGDDKDAVASSDDNSEHVLGTSNNAVEMNPSMKSRFERDSQKMQKRIKEIEAENVAQKPWQLTGEATATKRPKNSLLEENLHFDQTLVAPPTVTEETTETLEQMIMQRIKDQAWDDVARKVKPVEKPFEYKKSLNLDQEKSKLSLAEIYEKEYIKKTEDVEEEEKNPDHEVIEAMMKKVFLKLDALSNFQFTPKQPKPELKIISNLPSVAMEESTPITVSTATLLAPEEVYDKKSKDLKGHDERTVTDRKKERRDKKTRKREIRKSREKKLKGNVTKNPGIIVKGSKKAALETLKKNKRMTKISEADAKLGKSLKSSTAFFTHLQENISKNIMKAHSKTVKNKKGGADKAEKYKL